MSCHSENNRFTFIWNIENFSMCAVKRGDYLPSPVFVVDMLEKTEWRLKLYPKGDTDETYMSCLLERVVTAREPGIITIGFSLAIMGADGSSKITTEEESYTFGEGHFWEKSIANLEDVFKTNLFLPNDVLSLRCCMWMTRDIIESSEIDTDDKLDVISHVYPENGSYLSASLSEEMYGAAKVIFKDIKKHLWPQQTSVRTRVELERRSITWSIDRFSERRLDQKIFFPVISAVKDSPTFILALCMIEDSDHVHIEVQRNNKVDQIFVKCTVSVLSAQNEDQFSVEGKHLFLPGSNDDEDADIEDDGWFLPPLIKLTDILNERDMYLKDDVLSLRCEIILSYEGTESDIEKSVEFPERRNSVGTTDHLSETKNELLRILKDGMFCDVSLQVGERTFSAHKAILCAVSPVFTAMFKNNMKEKTTGVVDIEDLDSGTMDRLLKYMYSGVLEDMQQDDVAKLYCAADKYQVMSLKKQCSDLLKSTLAVPNVSEVLTLAVVHQDKDLKKAVLRFISIFANEIFRSSSENHPVPSCTQN